MDEVIPTTDRGFMLRAIDEAAKCVSEPGKISPCVGAVIVKDGNFLGSAHRSELKPGDHAEFTLLQCKLPGMDVTGATVYTTLEPCTERNPPKTACAKWLADRKVGEVVIGLLDPDPRIYGNGLKALKEAGIKCRFFPPDLRERLERIDAKFRGKFVANANSFGTATFNYMRNNGIFTIGHGDVIFETRWDKETHDSIRLRNDTPSIATIAVAIHATTFDEVTDPGVYDMSSWVIPVNEGEIAVLKNRYGHFALVKVVDVKHKSREHDNRDELTIEFKILDDAALGLTGPTIAPPLASAIEPNTVNISERRDSNMQPSASEVIRGNWERQN